MIRTKEEIQEELRITEELLRMSYGGTGENCRYYNTKIIGLKRELKYAKEIEQLKKENEDLKKENVWKDISTEPNTDFCIVCVRYDDTIELINYTGKFVANTVKWAYEEDLIKQAEGK